MAFYEFNKYLIPNYDPDKNNEYYLEFQKNYNDLLNGCINILNNYNFRFIKTLSNPHYDQIALFTNFVFSNDQVCFVIQISSVNYLDNQGDFSSSEIYFHLGYYQIKDQDCIDLLPVDKMVFVDTYTHHLSNEDIFNNLKKAIKMIAI